MTAFCGACIAYIRDGSDHRVDGVRLCTSCATDDIVSIDNKQGYTGGEGGIGKKFSDAVTAKHDEIVPAAVVKLDRQINVTQEPFEPTLRIGARRSMHVRRG